MKVFSGVKPSGILHLGNYLGALRQWVDMQNTHDCLFCVVDLHALTVKQDPIELARHTLETVAIYLACGIDPKRATLFVQSQVPQHAELCWILNTLTKMSELKLMHQFKEKSKSRPENINIGLFDYPVLMAADILLYDTEIVPVGEDQMQHIELAREIARRFNGLYGDTFVVPEGVVPKIGARIKALDNPEKKMEKTGSVSGYIALTDEPDVIRKKIKHAVTDSGSEIVFDEKKKPALANLLTVYHLISGEDISVIQKRYEGKGYKDFKDDLASSLISFLAPIREKFFAYMDDPASLSRVINDGAERAQEHAAKKIATVKNKIGLIP